MTRRTPWHWRTPRFLDKRIADLEAQVCEQSLLQR
jgi:hypothetical protein